MFAPAGDATVLTLDGAGDGICATVGAGRGHDLTVRAMTPKFHSPAAWMYSAVTAHLGLKPYEHEYKIMGMAPYGQPEVCVNGADPDGDGDCTAATTPSGARCSDADHDCGIGPNGQREVCVNGSDPAWSELSVPLFTTTLPSTSRIELLICSVASP